MSLKLKVAIIVTVIFLILGIVDYHIRQHILYPSFISLEKEEAKNNAARIEEAFVREIHHLDTFAHDWAAWDAPMNL